MDDPAPSTASVAWVAADAAKLVRLAFETGGDNLFDYAVPDELADELAIGQRVRAPLGRGNRLQVAFCVDFPKQTDVERVKPIAEIVDQTPLIGSQLMELARWLSRYYCCPLGAALSAMLPAAVKKQVGVVKRSHVVLTNESADDHRISAKGRAILDHLSKSPKASNEGVLLDDVASATHCGKQPFRTLARMGLIQIVQREQLLAGSQEQTTIADFQGPQLNIDQQAAFDRLTELTSDEQFHAALLLGVTGSGKTEIYIRCIERVLAQGRQAIVLVPEIALTPQAVSRFMQRFPRVAVLHSGLSNRQRNQHWTSIATGAADVVVGARSAVFAPLTRLGLVVVDEEHEPSYKQDSTPRYHGRDVAIKRAQMAQATIILGSATPSLETLHNAQSKDHYELLRLPRRVLDLPLPPVTVVNMRDEMAQRKGSHLFSLTLETELRRCLQQKRQAVLLLNRRGHNTYVFCPSCNYFLTCPNCDVSLTCHKRTREWDTEPSGWAMCHYCLYSSRVPQLCPVCAGKLMQVGPGTQRAEEELAQKIPQARVYRVDSDSMRPGNYDAVLSQFGAGEIDILLGTQMIGKGLDFPNVALVGVLNADTALSLPDFRSSERTFQLIAQVAGRCGRADSDGRVVVQSFVPEDPAIELACKHDFDEFAVAELAVRKRCTMPPYQRLVRIIMRDRDLEKLQDSARQLRNAIEQLKESEQLPLDIRGPVPATIAQIENQHRQEILIKAPTATSIQSLLARLRQDQLPRMTIQTAVDVDPINLM